MAFLSDPQGTQRNLFCPRRGNYDKRRCDDITKHVLHRQIYRNGVTHFCWVCSECGSKQLGSVPKPEAEARCYAELRTTEDLIMFKNNSAEGIECEVAGCGSVGTEFHHWAPQALFEDAGEWPTSYLCVKHHVLWHQRLGK